MGRLIAVVLFIALMVPAGLLVRGWSLAADRRAVASAAVQFVVPTQASAAELTRQAVHGRRVRQLGLVLGVLGVIASIVVLAEACRPRPRWAASSPPRRPRGGDLVSPWVLWTMRGAVAGEVLAAVLLADELGTTITVAALAVPLLAWLLAGVALLRVLLRPVPAEGADVPVDEAQRTWTAHLVVAAASVLALLPLGSLLLVAGLGLGERVSSDGAGLVPVALVAGGFSALSAGLAVAVLLLTWLRPLRHTSRQLAN